MFSSQNSQVSSDANYIEDVFSTYLYTGNGSTQTITNGIDLSTKGGLVWTKSRSNALSNVLNDTARGLGSSANLYSNNTTAGGDGFLTDITSFNTSGYSLGYNSGFQNASGYTYASWTFREQPKFFDVVTYTGDGTAGKTVSHNLGSVPGCIIVKRTDSTANWAVQHRSLTADGLLFLNSTAANNSGASGWNSTEPTSTQFTVGTNAATNASGATYVAYLFAHNAGGFGLTGTDNVISCGSFTTTASNDFSVTLGYEPQWLMIKAVGVVGSWFIEDNMRGFGVTASSNSVLSPNLSDAEVSNWPVYSNSTGFNGTSLGTNRQFIYIAIRRGPMKVPTSGTSVFSPNATSGTTDTQITTNFPLDLNIVRDRTASTGFQSGFAWSDRLRELSSTTSATTTGLQSTNTNAETTGIWGLNKFVDNIGFKIAADYSGLSQIYYSFRRAPSFFDEVCYTGTGNAMTVNHNLGVTPELMIVKGRSGATGWVVYTAPTGATKYMRLDNTNAAATLTAVWNDTSPTSSVFTVGSNSSVNTASATYVTYLFATCAGVSKVGSYTGNGSTQTINCGFTGGARFVLIKRTDVAGDWYVYDTARGMTTLTDPYLRLNSTAAESATLGSVTTVSTGFAVNASILAAINTNAASYIFLAIA